MKKLINLICVAAGFLFSGIGVVGIMLRILPTTPFLLLAAVLFAKGSEKFHRWFLATNIYKKYIDQVVKDKSMTKQEKKGWIDFAYPDAQKKKILKEYHAQFQKNKIYGIWGRSGCGKSTLLKLLMRFYEPEGKSSELD